MTMAPWPRRLINFPIILLAITQQLVWGVTVAVDQSALHTTGVSILSKVMPWWLVSFALIGAAMLACFAFHVPRRIETLLLLLPQQGMLILSAGGALIAIKNGEFADGVIRSVAFLMVDQVSLMLVAFFHTWAIVLIMLYSQDRES